jgi:molybdenum cofactor cytidylyltransferase
MGRPKQIIQMGDDLLLSHVLKMAIASNLEKLVLVLGHNKRSILSALGDEQAHPKVQIVVNDRYREGMSTSLQAGLAAVRDLFPSIMVLLGDQPFVDTDLVNRLLGCFQCSDMEICVPVHKGRQGLPVCFFHIFYDAIMQITGDQGARSIIRDNPKRVLQINIDNPQCFFDIDDEDDLKVGRSYLKC